MADEKDSTQPLRDVFVSIDAVDSESEKLGGWSEVKLRYSLHSEFAKPPERATFGSVGYDLSSIEKATIPAHGKVMLDTGVSVDMPLCVYGQLASRSGLAWRNSIIVGGGVIDPDYEATIRVILFNLSDTAYEVNVGDRVCQLVLVRCETPTAEKIEKKNATDTKTQKNLKNTLWVYNEEDDDAEDEDEEDKNDDEKSPVAKRGRSGFGSTGK